VLLWAPHACRIRRHGRVDPAGFPTAVSHPFGAGIRALRAACSKIAKIAGRKAVNSALAFLRVEGFAVATIAMVVVDTALMSMATAGSALPSGGAALNGRCATWGWIGRVRCTILRDAARGAQAQREAAAPG